MDLLSELNAAGRNCTGCSLCANICHVGAIIMSTDNNGFYKPVIKSDLCVNCQQCKNKCPQINNFQNDNLKEPLCYAVKADEDTLEKSASGGAFSILSDYIFEIGGYVCGAAYDDDFMGVSHIMISDKNQLYRLRGSKYVYSKPGVIYKEVKEKLDQGSVVLFSGLPCQVAALNSYLSSP